jgi:hypothetical protein
LKTPNTSSLLVEAELPVVLVLFTVVKAKVLPATSLIVFDPPAHSVRSPLSPLLLPLLLPLPDAVLITGSLQVIDPDLLTADHPLQVAPGVATSILLSTPRGPSATLSSSSPTSTTFISAHRLLSCLSIPDRCPDRC